MKLENHTAIITGAAGDIGQAFCVALAREGARIVAADIRSAEKSVIKVKEMGGEAFFVETDVSSADSTRAMADAAMEKFGSIDIHVNNAGILTPHCPFDQISEESWDTIMNVNLKGMWQCAKAVVPQMKKQGRGKIINIGSATLWEGLPHALHYVSSKAGVYGFTRALARELTGTGINVNIITPGLTMTEGIKKALGEETIEHAGNDINAQRIIQRDELPKDLCGALIFLASDDSDFISGQVINVDGGVSLH